MDSPNLNGSTSLLTNEFIKGAKENNQEIKVFNVLHMNIKHCIGCLQCLYNGPCV